MKKIPEETRQLIQKDLEEDELTVKEIAERYRVSPRSVSNIKKEGGEEEREEEGGEKERREAGVSPEEFYRLKTNVTNRLRSLAQRIEKLQGDVSTGVKSLNRTMRTAAGERESLRKEVEKYHQQALDWKAAMEEEREKKQDLQEKIQRIKESIPKPENRCMTCQYYTPLYKKGTKQEKGKCEKHGVEDITGIPHEVRGMLEACDEYEEDTEKRKRAINHFKKKALIEAGEMSWDGTPTEKEFWETL